MPDQISLTYYSDVLCVWAHIAQARVEEIENRFPGQIRVQYRFCSVFGDTAHKIGRGWAERGSYQGFGEHLHQAVVPFDHVTLHPEIWQRERPASSTPAHLVLKAVQGIDPNWCEPVLIELRRAFFEQCRNISAWRVLEEALRTVDVPPQTVRDAIDSGAAHAALEADRRDQQALMVQGSPTFLLNEGRQKLYGNVGYGVIEANIKELLRSPTAGAASWC